MSDCEGGHSEGLPGNRHWALGPDQYGDLKQFETMPKGSMLTQDKNMEAGDMSPMFQVHVPGNTFPEDTQESNLRSGYRKAMRRGEETVESWRCWTRCP